MKINTEIVIASISSIRQNAEHFLIYFPYVFYFLGIIYSDPFSNIYSNWSSAPSNDRHVPRPMGTFLSLPSLSFLLHAIQMTTSSFMRKWQWNHSLNMSFHFLGCFLSFFASTSFFIWPLNFGVPQDQFVSPLLFILYCLSLNDLIESHDSKYYFHLWTLNTYLLYVLLFKFLDC